MVVYIIYRHWNAMSGNMIALLGVFIGVQTIYQWRRVMIYYAKLRKLYAVAMEEGIATGSPLDVALRTAAGGIVDLLFYDFGTRLVSLFFLIALLYRIDGIRW
jgi:hypothetical protein